MDWKEKLASISGLPEPPESDTDSSNEGDQAESKELTQKEPLMIITDKKGRKGKTATIIEGFRISQEEVEKIAKELKNQLGVGGSTREGEILLQGDYKNRVTELLKKKNFKVK